MKSACVVGLGYVGLPLAVLLAQKGYKVYGYDIDSRKVDLINQCKSPMMDEYLERELPSLKGKLEASINDKIIADAETVIVCVPTPIDEFHQPDLKPVIYSSEAIAKNLQKGQLISVESTIAPGTCTKVVKPILEKSGLMCDKDFYLAHCPERIDPGNKKFLLKDLPRTVGATGKEGLEKAVLFYGSIIESQIKPVSTIEAAEASKVVENAFRDINIAFVNELARSFKFLGIDVTEVIEAAATKPFGFMPHWPGVGVGGHCISVDPYYLIDAGEKVGFSYEFMKLARKINNGMPSYTVEQVVEGLNEMKLSVNGTNISVLGLAYKPNVDDARESPSYHVVDELRKRGALLSVYDPYVPADSNVNSLEDALKSACLVLCTAHDVFKKQLTPETLYRHGVKVVIDGRNCLDKKGIQSKGIIYRGIGK